MQEFLNPKSMLTPGVAGELEALRLENERLKQATQGKQATGSPAPDQRQFFRKW